MELVLLFRGTVRRLLWATRKRTKSHSIGAPTRLFCLADKEQACGTRKLGAIFPKSGLGEYQNAHLVYQSPGGHDTNRAVTVPNVGGMVGASFRIENIKVSAGYRADLFFNAMDVGIDARKSSTLGIYGPFVSVSVGLGGSGQLEENTECRA